MGRITASVEARRVRVLAATRSISHFYQGMNSSSHFRESTSFFRFSCAFASHGERDTSTSRESHSQARLATQEKCMIRLSSESLLVRISYVLPYSTSFSVMPSRQRTARCPSSIRNKDGKKNCCFARSPHRIIHGLECLATCYNWSRIRFEGEIVFQLMHSSRKPA